MYVYVCMFTGMGAHEQNVYTHFKYVCRDQRAVLAVTPKRLFLISISE